MGTITWDIAILSICGGLIAFSLFIRKHKALATLVSSYIAYFIAQSWGQKLSELLQGERVIFSNVWIQANTTPYAVQLILLLLFTVLLSTFLKLGGRRSRYGILEVVVYAVCTVSLLLLFTLSILPEENRQIALESSKILPYIYQWREWVVVLPVLAMIGFGILSEDDL